MEGYHRVPIHASIAMAAFFKTTILGGILFLLPLAIVLMVLGYLLKLAATVVTLATRGGLDPGLVVDVVSDEGQPAPRPVLDNDYEIRPCQPDPQEDPVENKAEAERDARLEPVLGS
jgi:hypothetical protein